MSKYNDGDAKREGWALFLCDDGRTMIQRLDDPRSCGDDFPEEPIFPSDAAAIKFVKQRANEGSLSHQEAMRLHGNKSNGA